MSPFRSKKRVQAPSLNSTHSFASYAIDLGPALDLMLWLARCPPGTFLRRLRLARQIQELLRSDLKTHFKTKVPLQEIGRALQQYAANMTTGKVLIMP
jgi:hypothetical protein